MKRTIKGFIALLLTLTMLCAVPVTGFAVGDSIKNAESIQLNSAHSGTLKKSGDNYYYNITLENSGRINIKIKAQINRTKIYIYDGNYNDVWNSGSLYKDSVSGEYSGSHDVDLIKGDYYVCINAADKYDDMSGIYDFSLSFKSANVSFEETIDSNDNRYQTGNDVEFNKEYNGQIAQNDDKDFYKITLDKSGRIDIDVTAAIYKINYYIYDGSGNVVFRSEYQYWNDITGESQRNLVVDLVSGDYYFCVARNDGTGNYHFNVDYTSANESFTETQSEFNNKFETASPIELNTEYVGQLASNDNTDFYKFTVKSSDKYIVRSTGNFDRVDYYVYDTKGNEKSHDFVYWNDTAKRHFYAKEVELDAGTYYFCAKVGWSGATGVFNFSISPASSGFCISFDAMGGFVANPAVWAQNGDSVTFPTPDYRSGYKFLGWAESSFSTTGDYSAGETWTVSEDKVFYAVWEKSSTPDPDPIPDPTPDPDKKQYTVTFNGNGGSVYPTSTSVKPGDIVTLPTPEGRDGYEFLGWAFSDSSSSADYQAGYKYTVSSDITFYAVWNRADSGDNEYKITYISDKGGLDKTGDTASTNAGAVLPAPKVNVTLSYDAGEGTNAPEAKTVSLECSGWSFDSYDTVGKYKCGATFYPTENTTLYAIFADSSSVTISNNVPRRDGYKFLGWAADSHSSAAEYKPGDIINISSDTTLYAIWETVSSVLRGDADGSGKVTAADARLALRISAKLETGTPAQISACDLNSDGKVTASEARAILRYAAKLDAVL